MEKKKLKMIRGSEERADEVKKQLLEWGAKEAEVNSLGGDDSNYYYCVDDLGAIRLTAANSFLFKYLNYEIVELPEKEPEKQPEHQFQPFEKVLCRCDRGTWHADFFGYKQKKENAVYPYVCVGDFWEECIPFEGNEHLLGTTDAPKGGER